MPARDAGRDFISGGRTAGAIQIPIIAGASGWLHGLANALL